MKTNEKIAAICLTFSILLLIIFCIFTLYQNKPQGYIFRIEKIISNYIK